ncbi:MAG: Nramp family divalent metal transporter [Planctomycetia bacterium]|nr:Nramp family divalent metal transporter [Planctomycetia bacterium]
MLRKVLTLLFKILLIVGPGLFCVGYTIGTGSVTSMIVSGSKYGTTFLWVVALSCIFSAVLMEAYGRLALVTGKTALTNMKHELPFGRRGSVLFAFVTMIMVIAGQWSCLSGLVGLTSHSVCEICRLVGLPLPGSVFWQVIVVAVFALAVLYFLFWFGNYSRFETMLVVLVTILGLSFIASLFLVSPTAGAVAQGLVPRLPNVPGGSLLIAAMVGTTLAAPTFVVRPILVLSKGWSKSDLKVQRRDAIFSALVMFIISGSIMCVAAGAIYDRGGKPVESVMDMVETLRPIAGSGASLLFLFGMISAGLSSILPIAMVAGFMKHDFEERPIDVQAKDFRVLAAVACLFGLIVPVLGTNPVVAQVVTQVAQVFVLPLVIGGIILLVNKKSLMGDHKAGLFLNCGLLLSFAFSLVMSWQAVAGLIQG